MLRTAWTDQDERAFEEFIERIGESDCRTVHECLTSAKSNPLYRASNPPGMHFNADCADLPYLLRAYFAWKNGLPFAYSASVTPAGRDSSDIRFNDVGVRISSRRDLTGPTIDARREIPQMLGLVTSAHFRYAPDYSGQLLPDHYPVKITRESIKPGTILYDPYGHLAVVYKVTAQGRVHFIDAHPGNALTRGVYGKAHKRYIPEVGGGFKRWRPQQLIGATQLADGSYQGGSIVLAADKDLADWSAEQFFGTEPKRPKDWEKGRFVHEGETLEYYQFVRRRLAKGHFRYDPVEETRSMVRVLCEDLQYRVHAVDAAIAARMHLRPQPSRLPDNIYGTSGDWEVHSTPSRDARLKTAFKELRDEVARFLELAAARSDHIAYSGSDLRRDLLDVYTREASACTISYARTDGTPQAAFVCRRHAAPASALVRSAPLRRTAVGRQQQGRVVVVPRWRRQGRVVCGRAAPAQPDRAHLPCAHGFLAGRSQTQGPWQWRGRSAGRRRAQAPERDGREHRAGQTQRIGAPGPNASGGVTSWRGWFPLPRGRPGARIPFGRRHSECAPARPSSPARCGP